MEPVKAGQLTHDMGVLHSSMGALPRWTGAVLSVVGITQEHHYYTGDVLQLKLVIQRHA